ncbi:hypothetical protein KJ359_009483 [Pestalotiopsis sp. 9143b]|nr:hypothetical protein KJ359_009483 [Pestalotiopsis sp. 9143b]
MSFSTTEVRPVEDDGDIADVMVQSTACNNQLTVIPPIHSRASQFDGDERCNASFPPDTTPGQSSDAAGKMSGTTITLTMTSLCLSATLSALDMTIVTTAVPAIVASLDSTAGYIWVGSAFILGFTAVTPIWGSISDLWGRRPIILIALAIFLVGSLLCALAPHMNALIAGRAVQVPLGAVVFIVLLFFLKVPSPNTSVKAGLQAIDWTGSAFCVGGALMVLLGLDFGDETYPWSSAAVICLIVFGFAAIGIFLVNEWKFAANPVIPLRLLSSWSKFSAYGVFSLNAYVLIGFTYYLPLYSQSVLGADALTSGLHLLPLIVSCSLSAAGAGVFIQQTGKYGPLMYAAQVLLTLGAGLFIDLEFEKNIAKLFAFEILAGVGVGLNIEAPVLAAQASTTVRDTAAVVATMGFLRSIATAVSVVVGGVIFQNVMRSENSALVDQLGPNLAAQFDGDNASANIESIGALPSDQQIVVRQAYFHALRTVWIMYVAIAGLSSLLSLFVSEYHLSNERKEVVLGVNREEPGPVIESGHVADSPIELTHRRRNAASN